ncbi:hypothetical protein DFH08DRAFT_885047 [Mycena albidolilacea]|uniref:Uncharacterized protein n=1 Tax=Mycena albidolilacea TaxID=1033008 RepID=A0AAD7EHR9_9AGAR|nr:hypothetical protein DFH08DRAFT_885047 [Mycena albidolilacea]
MYPDGRANPAPVHFAKNSRVEIPPVSRRLLHQRHLDREGRAICRIVYSHGIGIETISNVFCVADDTVIRAIENKATDEKHDKAENDYWYVSAEYREKYPSLSGNYEVSNSRDNGPQAGNSQSCISQPTKVVAAKKPQSSGCDKDRGNTRHSDLGEDAVWLRNPTARDFKDNRPVINESVGKLDRKGRAICRIVHRYFKNYTKIATIFGISRHDRVRRAVLNDCSSRDDVAEDYDYAGKEFKNEYPPASIRCQQDSDKRPRSPELDDVPQKRARRDKIPASQTRVPQKILVVELPARSAMKVTPKNPVVELLPMIRRDDPGTVGIKSFLGNIGGFDLSHWQETFKEKGLNTMGDLATLASLEESRLVKTLTRLFSGNMAEVHIILLADALLDLAKDTA